MSKMQDDTYDKHGELSSASGENQDELQQLLTHGITFQAEERRFAAQAGSSPLEDEDDHPDNDVQGAMGLFAEAAQDMATAGLELALGRHFACVDYCNQVAEKAAQAVSLLLYGHRSMYDHDLAELGARVGAPKDIQEEMARLTPFHPEAFYKDTPPEEADEVINAEQASSYVQSARSILRWARNVVLNR
jgi:HEPN domain-containing protein